MVVKTAMLSDRARCNVGNPLLTQQHSLPVSSPWGLVAQVTKRETCPEVVAVLDAFFRLFHSLGVWSAGELVPCPGKRLFLFFWQVRHVCDGKSIRVRSVVSTSSCPAHSTACSRCTSQVSAVHVSVFVQGLHPLHPSWSAHLQTRLCSHPWPRQLSCKVSPLHVNVTNLLHRWVILTLCMHK